MPIRITGLNSGLDTETIISALVSSYNYKTEKYKKAQTKLSWKQDAWKTLNAKIYSLYQSVGNLRFSNAYSLKTAKVSDSTKATVKAGANAPTGTQKMNILQVAQAGYLTGGKLDSSTTTGTTLAELGYTGGDGKINITKGDGTTTQVTVSQGTTVNDFLNSLKNAGLNANYDSTNHRIYVTSKDTGAANDFTLTGANADGVMALTRMGLNVESDATDATYTSYTKYYGTDGTQIEQTVVDAIQKYIDAQKEYATKSAQNANMTNAYGYASAYSAMVDALKKSGLGTEEQKKLQTLLGMSATERVNSVMSEDGTVYSKKGTDINGDTIYADKAGNLIKGVTTYKDAEDNVYTAEADGTYKGTDGLVYKQTQDENGNTVYEATGEDGETKQVTISSETKYYKTEASGEGTGAYTVTDADGNVYTKSKDSEYYTGTDGNSYRLSNDNQLIQVDEEGRDVEEGKTIATDGNGAKEITQTVYSQGDEVVGAKRSADVLTSLKEEIGENLTDDEISTLTSNIAKVNAYESATDSLESSDPYSRESIIASIHKAYNIDNENDKSATDVTAVVNNFAAVIAQNKADMQEDEETIKNNQVLANLAKLKEAADQEEGDGDAKTVYKDALAAFVDQVEEMHKAYDNMDYNTDAKKVDGADAKITLNGVEYENSRNNFSVNGLDITVQEVTGEGDENAITITTDVDTQGIYDKIKDFLTQYNALINEITSLYNADSAKGYEPLSSDEKDAMSESDIELWEQKIKDSLLRRDDTLSSVMNAMTSAMSKGVQINGKTYYLSNFGIRTLGYFDAATNQQNAYHIDGDEDDTATAGNADKLMAAIMNDPDTITQFMQGLSKNLYDSVGNMMKSTTMSSIYTVYNDKEMASEYSDYTSLIKKWEEKLQAQEDYWYKKFAAMETALAKLNSQTSALSGLFGN